MKKRQKTKSYKPKYACHWSLTLGLGTVLTFGLASQPACAEEEPFQVEQGRWMSFDHYKDADSRGVIKAITPPPAPEPAQKTPAAPAEAPQTAAAAPTVAAPNRPIDLPVMPGMNKGFDVHVTSTEDERVQPSVPVVSENSTPDIHLSSQNWQAPTAIAKTHKEGDDEDTTTPLNVRMSFLPNKKVTPIPSPERASAEKLGHMIVENQAMKKKEAVKTPAEAAACAALDAYKKQQVDALQSDRQTLQALQEAISSLGLQKQLGFITGNNSALNAAQTPKTDTPAPTSVQ